MYENVLEKFCLAFTVLNLALKWISEYVCIWGVEELRKSLICVHTFQEEEKEDSQLVAGFFEFVAAILIISSQLNSFEVNAGNKLFLLTHEFSTTDIFL